MWTKFHFRSSFLYPKSRVYFFLLLDYEFWVCQYYFDVRVANFSTICISYIGLSHVYWIALLSSFQQYLYFYCLAFPIKQQYFYPVLSCLFCNISYAMFFLFLCSSLSCTFPFLSVATNYFECHSQIFRLFILEWSCSFVVIIFSLSVTCGLHCSVIL